MHILFLTDNFPPESNAPANRTHEHAREWVKAGHKVTIITCAPNFPHGRVFPGYRNRFRQTEQMDGITVVRVWSFMASNTGFLLRVLDFLSFMISGFLGGLKVRRPDIVVGTSPQFFTVCAAFMLARVKRVPFVFEIRDLWPESLKAVSIPGAELLISLAKPIAHFLYNRADHFVVVTNGFKLFLEQKGIPSERITVIRNGIDLKKFVPIPANEMLKAELKLNTRFVVGYIGTQGMAHHLETIIDAARLAKNDPKFSELHFITVGTGAEMEKLKYLARDLDNFTMIGQVDRAEIPKYWSLLDASVIHLRDDPVFDTVIPSKLFEAMGMGVPILHGVRGESAEIVEEYGVGCVFGAERPNELLDAAERLMKNPQLHASMKSDAVKAAKNFDRADQARKMADCLHEVLLRNG